MVAWIFTGDHSMLLVLSVVMISQVGKQILAKPNVNSTQLKATLSNSKELTLRLDLDPAPHF